MRVAERAGLTQIFGALLTGARPRALQRRVSPRATSRRSDLASYDPAALLGGFDVSRQAHVSGASRRRTFTIARYAWLTLAAVWLFLAAKLVLCYRFDTFTGEVWGLADDAYITADFSRT